MRTPAAILDIDVTGTFPSLDHLHTVGTAHVLFRLHGRPIAWTTATVDGGRIDRDTLIRALLESHAWGCAVPLAERAVAAGVPPRYLDVAGLLQPPPRPAGGPLVTGAICHSGPASRLDACLAAVEAGGYPHLDLLVVDGSDQSRRVETLVRDRGGRYVREVDHRRMVPRAIAECRGDILALTDGDARPHPHWVWALVHVFLSDPDVMVATGPILSSRTHASAPDLARAAGVARRWMRLRGDVPAAVQMRRAANLAWWRPALGDVHAADRRRGLTLVYEPSAIVRTDADVALDVLDGADPRPPAMDHTVDLAEPMRPIDATGHETLRLRVSWNGRPLGVARTAGGGVVSPLQITDAVAQQLTAAVLDAGLGVGETVCRALVTADLARFVLARHGGSLRWPDGGASRHTAVA